MKEIIKNAEENPEKIKYNEKVVQTQNVRDFVFERKGKCDPKKCKSACCKFYMVNGGFGTDDYIEGFLEKTKYGDFKINKYCKHLDVKNNKCKVWGTDNFPKVCRQFPHITDSVYKHVFDVCSFKFEIKPYDKIGEEKMGLETSYYVGPYLECHWHYMEKETGNAFGCPKCKKEKNNGNFCSDCGSKLGNFLILDERKSYDFDCEDFDEVFVDTGEARYGKEGIDFLILNFSIFNNRMLYIESEEIYNQEILPMHIIDEKNYFEKEQALEYIQRARDKYDSVDVKWGIVTVVR